MRYVLDIDGVLVKTDGVDYRSSVPIPEVIRRVNKLFDEGNVIILYTARGSKTGVDWKEFTWGQMLSFGVKFNELVFGKPYGDWYIDDRGINVKDWLKEN
jgi:ribonucleotide monophosphatase NagD (HAD superfamily)